MKSTVLAATLMILALPAFAQRWQWPETPKNLTVLPKTTGGRDLQRLMFSFTGGLGVRCTFCHVGEEGKDFSEYDFASDAKPEKNGARLMIKMMNDINSHYLADFRKGNSNPLEVSCMTCHHGNSKPILLEDRLKRTCDQLGLDSTIKQYRALREQFYGGFTYNFKESSLMRLADKILEDSTKQADGIAILKLNVELFPTFAPTYGRLAGVYESQGNIAAAIESYEQAIKINPNNEMAKRRLERLRSKQ